ncbi:Hsp70 family protein [Actinacidiphila epipremni]|uniref:HSP70 family protein n=1 Tax=Actinacidiphila epipremni TaxID=2053013 RepID=A0ABX0ZHH8_9ACTN|nr:Hsp70 family protein [Actinacidiphila epipremni]NJP43278.1 HSP70 family protein [Actinacidiphila epipremni]
MISPYPVVAAIDFGTHGTGYAWTEVGDESGPGPARLTMQIREQWPGTLGHYPKDLSAVLLDPSGQPAAWGHEAGEEWARRCEEGDQQGYTYAQGFKMALRPGAMLTMSSLGDQAASIDTPAKAYPLVVAYLRRMYRITLEEIEGSGYLERQIRWCLTIPAIWDDAEKQLMRDAAVEAGMPAEQDRLILAREPEAAALYCQIHLARVIAARDEDGTAELTRSGSRFMVVDCGGGTVDITAYRVAPADSGERRRLIEIGKVSGGKIGSEFINQAFADRVLTDRLGGPQVVERIRRERPHALRELMQHWESGKIAVTATMDAAGRLTIDRPVYVPLPRAVDPLISDETRARLRGFPGGSESRIVVSPEEVRVLFDTVLKSLAELVEQQLKEMRNRDGAPDGPERLLLVGGLSSSPYLKQRLLAHFGDGVVMMRTTEPAAAVLRGAVLLGYDPELIISRRSRYTYGCAVVWDFEPGRDPVSKRIYDPEGNAKCSNRFMIFVRNGDTVETGSVEEPKSFSPLYADMKSVVFQFFRTLTEQPRYIDEPGCEAIGTLTVELGSAMTLPLAQRNVLVHLGFGDAEISVRAVNQHSGQELDTTLRFDGGY